MHDRYQIMDDQEFWTWLEHGASAWLAAADDRTLRHYMVDGFLPDTVRNTKRGVEVDGFAHVYGPGIKDPFRFTVSVPQKMLQRRREKFAISQLYLDPAQEILRLEVDCESQGA